MSALASNTSGSYNTAKDEDAPASDTDTSNNTAIGYAALSSVNRYADLDNVAVGYFAMGGAVSFECVAVGARALAINTGQLNVAVGEESLTANTIGLDNTAVGWRSLFNNHTVNSNTVDGLQAMFFNETGSSNVAIGVQSLMNNTTGNNNIALGNAAGANLTSGDNNIDIGNVGVAGEANTIRIGEHGTHTNTYIAGIKRSIVPTGVHVVIDCNGHLGTRPSSKRFKEAVQPMDNASEAIPRVKAGDLPLQTRR